MIPEENNNNAAAEPLFADSFLDFDSLKNWFLDIPDVNMSSLDNVVLDAFGETDAKRDEDSGQRLSLDDKDGVLPRVPEPVCEVSELRAEKVKDEDEGVGKVESVECVTEEETRNSLSRNAIGEANALEKMKVENEGVGKVGNVECVIDEEMKKVSLDNVEVNVVEVSKPSEVNELKKAKVETEEVGMLENVSLDNVEQTGVKSEAVKDEEDDSDGSSSESESESQNSSASLSSSGSSSDDDDDDDEEEEEEEEEEGGKKDMKVEVKEAKMAEDVEEGEIRENDKEMASESEKEDGDVDKMVSWSDIDEDIAGGAVNEPIKSKNELKDLPPVPAVEATLQPHHQLSPIGVVLSILGAQVIVEGVEQHSPLNEGSILWITERRSPLGLVDEIFGPVKNPYYVVRYNSESEVPAGISQGMSISFVQEFAKHLLNDKNLYKKGYDASGENDEEVSDEAEFSDDEKEAEYRRKQKMSKRGLNDQKPGNKKNNKKNVRDKDISSRSNRPPPPSGSRSKHNQSHYQASGAQSVNHGNKASAPAMGQMLAGGNSMVPTFPQVAQTVNFLPQSSGVYTNAMPSQQPQNTAFPPANVNQWLPQTHMQQPYQMPVLSGFPSAFNQQFVPNQGPRPYAAIPGGLPNFTNAPMGGVLQTWPGVMGPNAFNQTPFGMGMQSQQAVPSINSIQQGMLSGGMQPPALFPGNAGFSQNFNLGSSSDHGDRPRRQGGGRLGGRRGPRPSR